MGSHLRWVIALLAALAIGQASAQYSGNPDYSRYQFRSMVRCESVGSARTFCRADTGGRVRVAKQLSQRPCIQGRSWGFNNRGIWVSRGCRADFAVSPVRHGGNDRYGDGDHSASSTFVDDSGRLVHCVATPNGRTYCGTHHTRYTISGNPGPNCVQGQTWGFDERGVWVTGGCNADFSYVDTDSASTSSSYVDSSGRLVHCVSTASGRTYCGTAHTRYVMAGNPNPTCVEGRTWGLDDRGVWVSSGCVADFSPEPGVYTDSSGRVVRCDSTGDGRTYCSNEPNRRFVLSRTRFGNCVEGQTWGIDDRGLWVSGGCKGDFDYQR
jgi:hypothetical protein